MLRPFQIVEERKNSPEPIWYKKKRYLFVGGGIITIILLAVVLATLYFTGVMFQVSKSKYIYFINYIVCF